MDVIALEAVAAPHVLLVVVAARIHEQYGLRREARIREKRTGELGQACADRAREDVVREGRNFDSIGSVLSNAAGQTVQRHPNVPSLWMASRES